MKKIAYILDDGKRSFTYERIAGFREAIRKSREDINLYVFRSGGFSDYDPDHNCGEYNIYHLPDFSDFDGIFLDINITYGRDANHYGVKGAEYVTKAAAASGKPVVAIAREVADFYYVGIDNHAAMTSMIRMLHEDMGLSDFWFLMGPPDNYENVIRTAALKEYCAAMGLPCEDWRFYAESYAWISGANGFRALFDRTGGKLPQAIVCANDPIAVGACDTAEQQGIKVPEDVLISGFDNLDIAAYHFPSITTVNQFRFDLGGYCMQVMERIWRGEPQERITYCPTEIILRESTGHPKPREKTLEERVAEALRREDYAENFDNLLCAVQYKLPGCTSVEEMCGVLGPLIRHMGCTGLYIVLDPALYDYAKQIDMEQDVARARFGNGSLRQEGYPKRMELVYAWEEGRGCSFPKKRVKGLFPAFDLETPGQDILFAPLHFMAYTVGYVAIRDCVKIMKTRNIARFINTLTMAMRSFFAGKKLEYINSMLSGVSMQDTMTGLLNRLGYHRQALKLFRRAKEKGERLSVLFVDMDGMKYFNDTFGHACGDDAVCSVSASILACAPEGAVCIRYGGDEFLILFPAKNEEEAAALVENIRRRIPREAAKRNMPDAPKISTGAVLTDPDSDYSLNDYVDAADKLMYNEKLSKKGGHS